MRRVYEVLILLLLIPALFGMQRSIQAASVNHLHPEIVANVALTGQTAAIPQTTIFTPAQTGLYRMSFYTTATVPGTLSGQWQIVARWTDDAGPEDYGSSDGALSDGQRPPLAFVNANHGPGVTMVVQALAATPISYEIAAYNPANGTYSLYITLERLQ